MATTFGWKGAVDTDVAFSEFYGGDHTILAWFLLQYPRAYAGPIVAVNGTGTFVVGQGDFNTAGGPSGQAHLLGLIEQARAVVTPAALDAGVWYHLALVRSGTQVRVLLNGQNLGAPMALTGTNAPAGTLRLGRPSPGTGVDNQEAQLYGMLDEVAVFSRALTDAEIQGRVAGRTLLTGNEPALLAGWSFSPTPPPAVPAALRRPVSRSGQTAIVPTTWTPNDLNAIPLPQHEPMELPFVAGDAWYCAQGTAAPFSHRGYAAFCWDFIIADKGTAWTDVYPNGSFKAPVVGTGVGQVVKASDVSPPPLPAAETENEVYVRQSDGVTRAYLHLLKGTARVSVGDRVGFGQPIAQISTEWRDPNRPIPHLHFATQPQAADMIGFVTIPTAFGNYDVRNADGSWSYVGRAIPQAGQIVRRRRIVSPRVPSRAHVSAVSRGPDKLDIFVTDNNGVMFTAAWQPEFVDSWHGWWALNAGHTSAKPGAPVHATSRSLDHLDAFVVGTDNRVYTGAWQPAFTEGWRGWWLVKNGMAAPGAHVTAVSRSQNKLDIFVVGTDGRVWTAAWEPGFADGWHGWWPIGNVIVPQGAMVAAVSRNTDLLDIFVTDVNGDVQTAAWRPGDASWRGWWRIRAGKAAPGAPVTAVSRSLDKLDIFVVGTDGAVWTAAWAHGFTDWRGWWRIGSLQTVHGAPVHVVSRSPDKLDVFATDVNGDIQTAAWEPAFADGWHGWWKLKGGKAAPGAPVTAVSRSRDKLDVFVIGTDGRVWTAAWKPAFADWQGWWAVGD